MKRVLLLVAYLYLTLNAPIQDASAAGISVLAGYRISRTDSILYSAEDPKTSGSQTYQYQYDADGIRVGKTDSTGSKRYTLDYNQDYPQVIEERLVSGTLDKRYLYGDDLLSQVTASSTNFYHYDALGSTRALSNSSAPNITDSYSYSPFGNLVLQSGNTNNTYLYTGEQFDPELGSYYLRARYYNPTLGRFISRDKWASCLVGDRNEINRYAYADNNPARYIDPSGNFFIDTALIT